MGRMGYLSYWKLCSWHTTSGNDIDVFSVYESRVNETSVTLVLNYSCMEDITSLCVTNDKNYIFGASTI